MGWGFANYPLDPLWPSGPAPANPVGVGSDSIKINYRLAIARRPEICEHKLLRAENRPVTPEGLASISTISYVPVRPGQLYVPVDDPIRPL